jgi:diguanylate cyclase (GGDEF)-like protein
MTTSPPGAPGPSDRLERARQTLADVGTRARATNIGRARELENVLMAAVAGETLSEGQRRSAERAAHMIAGSAGTIGMHQVSELARELEIAIVRGSITEPAGLLHAVGLLREIQRRLQDETGDGPTATEPTVEGRREILVVTADEARATSIALAAQSRGWASRWAVDVASTRAALRRASPDVVVLDAALEPLDGGSFLLGSTIDRPRLPTVVLGGEDDGAGRAAAIRAGADAFVDVDGSPEVVVAIAIDAAGLPPAESAAVLALTDPGTFDALEAALLGPAFRLTTLAAPAALESALEAGAPDVLVVAVDGRDDLELCRTLRRDPRSAAVPLVALTSRLPDDVAAAYKAGADDVVGFPLVPEELVSTVSTWAERSRLRRHARDSDPASGLPGRAAASAAFERLAGDGQRLSSPMSVALLDVDGLRALNQEHGYAFGDLVLRRIARLLVSSLREEDVVARWGGQEYLVLMPGLRKADGVARLAAVLESLRNHTFVSAGGGEAFATFSAAVAEQPADGTDLPALVRLARPVLASAKRAGGNRVLPLGWTPQPVRNSTDVFIVEDDEMLAGLLQQALDTRGLRSEHEMDGRVALERLTGPNRLSARVILLDVDLPGMNGLDVLRRLETEGILQHSHVIMLTAYAGEQDVVTAMRHGAFDHAAKPFSLPVLTQRLRRALDSLPPP